MMFNNYREGDQGTEVSIIQEHLIDLGYLSGLPNGFFGPLTKEAVEEFQVDNALTVDGVVGKKTLQALEIDFTFLHAGHGPPNREDHEPDLWYPNRVQLPGNKWVNKAMKTKGGYRFDYPEGAIIHYTAGRSRTNVHGGKNNATTHFKQGIRSLRFGVSNQKHTYILIARDGSVFQNFPLNRWGAHAGGGSKWVNFKKGTVSMRTVGIELMCAGRLNNKQIKKITKDANGKRKVTREACPKGFMAADFSFPAKGDKLFDLKTECRSSKGEGNIRSGTYHMFSKAQEESLVNLLLWLEENGNGIFSFDDVAGHDEVHPKKKYDPGASLSMTMDKFRQFLKDEKLRRRELPLLHLPGTNVSGF